MAENPKVTAMGRVGLMCSSMCGGVARRRSMANSFRKARAYCTMLERSVTDRNDVPVEHLRAAEQHLIMIEKWLVHDGIHALRSNTPPALNSHGLMRMMGVSEGHERDEALLDFHERVSSVSDEIFISREACAACTQSRTTRFPGKVFISSYRLCFESAVLGMRVRVDIPWTDMVSLRYIPGTNKQKTSTFPVRMGLKTACEIDGDEVKEVDFRMFDYNSLKVLHQSATYFLGSGLFGSFSTEGGDYDLNEHYKDAHMKPNNDEQSATCALQQHFAMWEVQRRSTVFSAWAAPSMPNDGVRKMRWCAMDPEGNFTRHPFVDEGADTSGFAAASKPPLEEVKFLDQLRKCQWELAPHKEGETDADGWAYATGFDLNMGWNAAVSPMSVARRRCWFPKFDTEGEVDGANHKQVMARLATTYIKQKAIGVGGATPLKVYEGNLGAIPLEKLAEEMARDVPWEADSNGGLMARYFAKIQARNMEVGAWTAGQSGQVQGQVRSLEYVMPLPPKPMCPKESRFQHTCHLVSQEGKLIFEQSTVALDTPAKAMALWMRDIFTVTDGNLGFVREVAVEWLTSSWLKSIIEAEAPKGAGEAAVNMLECVKDWAAKS